jgi:GntR family transcriptional regulator/MocR family aminotransferase
MMSPPPSGPIYRRVRDWIRLAIHDGRLGPGDRVPSIRALAAQLGVARGTVDVAYGILCSEGYLVARGATGTFVSATWSEGHSPGQPADSGPSGVSGEPPSFSGWRLPFYPGLPALDLFPRTLWSRLVTSQVRTLGPRDLSYSSSAGDERLRACLASYLNVSRGITCRPDQIIMTGGYRSALDLIGRLLLAKGDTVWVEDPGFPPTREILRWVGASPVAAPVDDEGLVVDLARKAAPDAVMCVVTPANQFPLGVALSAARRHALLDWARASNAWIVEDDYDSEFYYDRRLLPSLKSLDRDDRVFYIGTFSKSLFPSLRLGYVVVPLAQAERFRSAARLGGGRPLIDQMVVADFFEQGHFARHISKMRKAYKERRAVLLDVLVEELGSVLDFDPDGAGLSIVARLKNDGEDVALVRRAASAGYRPMALSQLSGRSGARRGLVLGFANVPPNLAKSLVQDFRRTILD